MNDRSAHVRVQDLALTGHGSGPGIVVNDRGGRNLRDLDPRSNIATLAEAGYVLFRGFEVDLASFGQIVVAHSSRVTLDPARTFHGGRVAQKVDAGTAAMGLHLENGNSPFRPDLVWFYSEKAASEGSQTTVCDGSEVWEQTSESARRQFDGKDIVYRRRVEERKWKTFVYHNLADIRPLETMETITIEDLLALVSDDKTTTITSHDDGSITYTFRTPAVHRSMFGGRVVWANSIFGPSYNYEAPEITFGDGHKISPELLAEMRATTERLTRNIDWRNGDVLLIDNTRVMHGRREIKDTSRTIFNALSYLSDSLRPATSGTPNAFAVNHLG